jgi:diguanylate cyclase (GGDEF)-like protein
MAEFIATVRLAAVLQWLSKVYNVTISHIDTFLMAQATSKTSAHRGAEYILVAIPNTNRASAVRTLALEFCPNVVLVRDGQEATQHIDRVGPPRLLICELSLPRVDGFAVLRHLRRAPAGARAAAIIVSSHESFRVAALKLSESLGISKVLPLDFDRPSLKRAIAAAMHARDAAPAAAKCASQVAPASESPSLEELISRVLFDVTRQFHVPIAAAYLQIREQRRFAAFGSIMEAQPSLNWSKMVELLPHAAATDDPLVVPDLEDHPLFGNGLEHSAIRGFAGVPLKRPGGTIWGALGVFDAKALTLGSDDIDGLTAFARDVASEIEDRIGAPPPDAPAAPVDRDERFEALEQLAATDPLTGLANRRGCEKSIAGEISRAERERKPLSCIMLDIDRFKLVNDTLGHQAGDQVLRELSAMLRQSVRAYDIVARWGGEEFLLVLPGADLEAARLLAERIRVGVQKLPTSVPGSVTISAGAAEFDTDYDFEATLRTADRRMYEAKAAGRNRVV